MSTDERMAPPRSAEEVQMVEPDVVRQMRELSALGCGLGWGFGFSGGAARCSSPISS